MANNLNSAPADLPTTEETLDDDVTHLIVDIAELQEHLEKTARIAASSHTPIPSPPEFDLDMFYETVYITNWEELLESSEERNNAKLRQDLIRVRVAAVLSQQHLRDKMTDRLKIWHQYLFNFHTKPRDQITPSDRKEISKASSEIAYFTKRMSLSAPDPDIIPKMKQVVEYLNAEVEWHTRELRDEVSARIAAEESIADV